MALYLDGQKIISGGSSGGGHTIVDDEGVSLEQRSNLQFLGAYSEDNATDDTTEVNIVREMTKAEFDELTEAEKTGLINITDITGGNDDRFQPVIYSEEEREIGVWIDGKPLYEKTIDFGALPNNTTKSVNHNISNLGEVAFLNGVAYKTGDIIPIPFSHSSNVSNQPQLSIGRTTINIRTANDQSDRIGYITVRYTKTTDQAGSGQWTPQGVPAHHYSEDEHVVGTWIDGSTLYEKVFVSTTTPTANTWNHISLGEINVVDFKSYLNRTSGSVDVFDGTGTDLVGNIRPLTGGVAFEYKVASGYLSNFSNITIIVQYTKSST